MTEEKVHISEELEPILKQISDPEIPVLSILDLGVVRSAEIIDNVAQIKITPTYSGCPAMDVIGDDIEQALKEAGYASKVNLILSPAWSTEWITEEGKNALREYGIAPPMDATSDKKALLGEEKIVKCTNCGSTNTHLVSQFGSTACKALFKCNDCQEPFDYFKCLI
ncbi:ring-1,2-phenylacetyl-CoA epoxidase subunit PaaD [Mesonia phycicola]|uniref:Ring-1,2-phenylacetyl-CoA epoxidase subunit PaaD n=1 Tax=Mesonia phycicola TaxID=579105 RepID=A0A1M6G1R0_9FLAO|nr:1,2-phenylacetyl-CoA epoxidase subunit PaaD [Mesonia phycicola]SHJ03860.1 ring-1,2-phenylacetyl-CoA epoxidase subunit PaaD [Mesonia phycicola]